MSHIRLFEGFTESDYQPKLPSHIIDYIESLKSNSNYSIYIDHGLTGDPKSEYFDKFRNYIGFKDKNITSAKTNSHLTKPACFFVISLKDPVPDFKVPNIAGQDAIFFYSNVDIFEGFISNMMSLVEKIESMKFKCYFSIYGTKQVQFIVTEI